MASRMGGYSTWIKDRLGHFRWAIYSIFLFYLTYVVGSFAFLSTSAFEKIVTINPFDGIVTIRKGWSFVPGIVHLRDVHVEVQDHNVHFKLDLPDLKATIDFFPLLKKKLVLTSVVNTDLEKAIVSSTRLKLEEEREKYLSDRKAYLESQSDSDPSKIWSVQIQGVSLTRIEQFSVSKWKFQGNASVTGGFYLKPTVEAQVFPGHLEIKSGSIIGLLDHLKGSLDAELTKFTVDEALGTKVFRFVNSELIFVAGLKQIVYLDSFLDPYLEHEIPKGDGLMNVKLLIRNGVVQSDTNIELKAKNVGFRNKGLAIYGNGILQFNVSNDLERSSKGRLSLNFTDVCLNKLSHVQDLVCNNAYVDKGRLSAWIDSVDLSLMSPFKHFFGNTELKSAESGKVPLWNQILPKEVRLNSGQAKMNLNVWVQKGEHLNMARKNGFMTINFRKMKGFVGKIGFTSKKGSFVKIYIPAIRLDQDSHKVDKVVVKIARTYFKTKLIPPLYAPTANWWMDLLAGPLVVSFSNDMPSIAGDAVVKMKDAWPILEGLNQDQKIPHIVYMILSLQKVKGASRFHLLPNDFSFLGLAFNLGQSVRFRGDLYYTDEKIRAAIFAKWAFISMGLLMKDGSNSLSFFPG